jgi:hypothetical protein
MPPVPFSSSEGGVSLLSELGDVQVDSTTLANGHELVYDAVDAQWKNAAGAGGALFAGTDDDFLYKDGAVARTGGMSNDPSATGKAVVVDPTLYRVGIGGANNAVNLSHTLEVAGNVRIRGLTGPQQDLTIDNEKVGMVTNVPLQLFSHNTFANAADLVEVDSNIKRCKVGGTLVVESPAAFDAPNSTDSSGYYRFKLQLGTFNRNPGWAQHDFQNPPLPTLSFPTGIPHPYIDSVPINHGTFCIGRRAGLAMVAGYNQRIVTFSNIVTFGTEDQCVYDPCNMRSYVVSNAHVGVSIPEPYRSRGHSGMMTFHLHYEGTFAGASATNGIRFYVKQYRGAGVFLRDLVLGVTDTRQTVCGSFQRTVLGASGVREDIVPASDYFEVFGENIGPDAFDLLLVQAKIGFVPQL